ncbi:O-antigen ligase domain-containing protein [Pseudaminobacter arsenicus]|uniref:O-antigen ligase domain-containing protein n=1 Tax=Borborobacter arsenicus TaxID=1851146 RepID=A0A432V9V9_9HYPH|nr:O-antigen ligase family protein [Pseudaminobacter arsenicus]RUM98896.1 O-antigen ligase domain-containing protein [Pseudaminobacter arsenicus]
MKFTTRSFLLRRRIDSWILLAGAVSLPLRIGLAGVATFLFSCIGAYLVAARHRSVRFCSNRFQLFAVLYAVWSCSLILWRDDHPLDDRQLGYSLLFALFAFAGAGMVLVARPMRIFVLGSRIGVALALAVALGTSLLFGGRIGIGGNEAVFGFVVAVAVLAATIPIGAPPKWAPNGPYYLIIGSGAALLSETRSVIAVLLIFALVELALALKSYSVRAKAGTAAIMLAVLVAIAPQAKDFIERRVIATTLIYSGFLEQADYSGRIRLAMWKGSVEIIAEHPVAGVGSGVKMQAVGDRLDPSDKIAEKFHHVHNSVLDELLSHGLIGLSLMLAALASALGFIWRHSGVTAERRNLVYFFLLTVSYGALHNPFLHETTLGAIFLYLGVFNAALRQRRLSLASA